MKCNTPRNGIINEMGEKKPKWNSNGKHEISFIKLCVM